MKHTISVIVPVYNVYLYLPQCVESLFAQSYTNLEIILIDDGSKDGSGALCDMFAEKDTRIQVIHKCNGGAASAKNSGLRVATGEYLAFLDSDDFLEPDAYEFMVKELEQNHADVVRCGFRNVYRGKSVEHSVCPESKTETAEQFLAKFTKEWTCGLLWDKLYRRNLFEGIFFEEGHRIDDEFFTYQGIMNAEKIVSFSKVVYNYRKRKSSVMASEQSKAQIVLDKLNYLKKRKEAVLCRFPQLREIYDDHYANALLLLAKDSDATQISLEQEKKQIQEFLREKPKMPMGIKLRLFQVLYSNTTWLLKKREKKFINNRLEDYFD